MSFGVLPNGTPIDYLRSRFLQMNGGPLQTKFKMNRTQVKTFKWLRAIANSLSSEKNFRRKATRKHTQHTRGDTPPIVIINHFHNTVNQVIEY